MDTLPGEVVGHIFRQLKGHQSDLASATAVCRSWNRFLIPFLYDAPTFNRMSEVSSFLQNVSKANGELVHALEFLVLRYRWDLLTDDHLFMFVDKCPNLHVLNVDMCKRVHHMSLEYVATYLNTSLEEVSLSGCTHLNNYAVFAIAEHCPNLKSLNVSECSITDEALVFVAKKCPHLERLDVSFCRWITEVGIQALRENCKNLREWNLEACFSILGGIDKELREEDLGWETEEESVQGEE